MVEENRPSLLYAGLILASLAIIGIGVFQGEIMSNYGGSIEDITYLNKSTEVADQITGLKDSIETVKITGIDVLDLFIAGTYNTVKLVFGVGDLYTTFITNIAFVLGIPGWAVTLVIVGVLCSILFGVVSIITKWRA